jgi:hypothetical protein
MRSRKHTAWKENRKFGDVHGGRSHPKITDNIFNRLHSFSRPGPHDPTPILVEDNPSSDYFFPLDGLRRFTVEEYADQYAMSFTAEGAEVLSRMDA